MKNLRDSLLFLFVLLAFGPTAWAQFSGGTGTEADPYQISSIADWNTLSNNVKNGTTYSGQYFILTADLGTSIDNRITTMVGTKKHPFQGIFDGNGKSMDFNIRSSERFLL